ncbi:hypothetical protein CGLO_14758 [Colletotrichum gloeosporioides Cg-14]|uniref:F-box domain-containing protein n=1 Tax=Colletotrichum gloeosporioides (strain Cg-14) TaxID=1237896 RepID=T0K375_COLGC|nr:hypothetical protein CGLO_14758 [Colletotrichum gloeosporioides Cg-14]
MADTQLPDTEPACLMSLPPEMLNEIAVHLELHDRYLFSETCRRARRLFGMDKAAWNRVFHSLGLRGKTPIEVFLAGVAFARPHHWLCIPCGRLHRAAGDPPPRPRTRRCDRPMPLCPRRLRLGLKISHVESALKMARMLRAGAAGADEVGARLRNLLTGVEEKPVVDSTKELQYRRVAVESTPKVVSGMFILHTRIEFIGTRKGGGRGAAKLAYFKPFRLCEHLCSISNGRNDLATDLKKAFGGKGREKTGSCGRCGIDYAIIANHGGFVVQSWQNLGRYDCPDDAVPKSFFQFPLYIAVNDRIWNSPMQGVGLMAGEREYIHVAGEIRKAYKREVEREGIVKGDVKPHNG